MTVYLSGTVTLATIYADNTGTAKANPFTAASSGQWFFYADEGFYDVRLSGGGIAAPFTLGDLRSGPAFNASAFGARGNGTTNDTAAVQAALDAIPAAGGVLYFPPGTFTICNVSTTKPVSLIGAGRTRTTIQRHSSCLQAATNMVTVTGAASLTIRDIGFDQQTNGSVATNNAVFVSQVNKVLVDGAYFTRGQSCGILVDRGSDIQIVNSTFYQNWWIGACIGGAGTIASPEFVTRVVFSGNTFQDMPYGVLVSVFAAETSITGNSFTNSSLGIAQETRRLTITGNVINGAPIYGVAATYDGMFVEASLDTTITGNVIRSPEGKGIYVNGSQLTISAVTSQLPILRLVVSGNLVESATTDTGIQIKGDSFDGTLVGQDIQICGNLVRNCNTGITVSSTTGAKICGNFVDETNASAITLATVKNSSITDNYIRNPSGAAANSHYGILITNTSLDLYIDNNHIIDDRGTHLMRFGIFDSTLNGGVASQVRTQGNVISGFVGGFAHFPAPAVPTLGTWVKGDRIQNTDVDAGESLGWICTVAGAPGTWQTIGDVPRIATATWDPPSIADGAVTATTVTIAGAAVGDSVYATLSTLPSAEVLTTAFVQGADTVRFIIMNKTGAPLDLASGTVTVYDWKPRKQ